MSRAVIDRYYAAFNAGDVQGMLNCLTDDVAHHVNEGGVRTGKPAFRAFCDQMNRSYLERLTDIEVMLSADGSRAAAEFIVHGTYVETDIGLPPANGQTYNLPGGTFFSFEHGHISRVVTYYNLQDWIRQVSE